MADWFRPVLDRVQDSAELLSMPEHQDFGDLRLAEGSGRPLGTVEFVAGLLTAFEQMSIVQG